jgi:hypothetical protein
MGIETSRKAESGTVARTEGLGEYVYLEMKLYELILAYHLSLGVLQLTHLAVGSDYP